MESLKTYNEFINESVEINEAAKDIMRLESMVKKSKGSFDKIIQYTRNMCKAVKDGAKAYARGEAALEVLGGDEAREISEMFFDRAKELGFEN